MDIGTLTGSIALEDQMSSALDLISNQVASFADNFDGALGAVVVGAGLATAAIAGITGAVTALAMQGAGVQDVSDTLTQFAGGADNAAAILERLTAGTKSTVDQFTLMQASSRILAAGVKLTADEFGTLGSAAFVLQDRGLGTTKEMLDLVSDAMVTGRTRALAMKLGVVDVGDAQENYAKSLGVTKAELNDSGKAEANRIAVMQMLSTASKDAANIQRDFGDVIDQAKTSVVDWTNALAVQVANSPAVMGAVNSIGTALQEAFGGSSEAAIQTIVGWIESFANAVSVVAPIVIEFSRTLFEGLVGAFTEVSSVVSNVGSLFESSGSIVSSVMNYYSGLVEVLKGVWDVAVLVVDIVVALVDKLGLLEAITTVVSGYFTIFGNVLKTAGGALSWVADNVRWLLEQIGLLDEKVKPAASTFTETTKAVGTTGQAMTELATNTSAGARAVGDLARSHISLEDSNKKATAAATKHNEMLKEAREFESSLTGVQIVRANQFEHTVAATIAATEAQTKLNKEVAEFESNLRSAHTTLGNFLAHTVAAEAELYKFQQDAAREHWRTISQINNELGLHQMQKDAAAMKGVFTNLFDGMKGSMKSLWEGLSGGAGIGGMFNNLGKGIMDGLGNIVSGGISSLISSGVGLAVTGLKNLFGGMFGKSEGRKNLEEANAQIAQLQADLMATHGSLDNIIAKGGAAGEALAAAWGSQNVEGLAHFKGLLDGFNAELASQAQITANNQAAMQEYERAARGSFETLSGDLNVWNERLRNQEAVNAFRSQLQQATTSGKINLQSLISNFGTLKASIGSQNPAIVALEQALVHYANTGVIEFHKMDSALDIIRDNFGNLRSELEKPIVTQHITEVFTVSGRGAARGIADYDGGWTGQGLSAEGQTYEEWKREYMDENPTSSTQQLQVAWSQNKPGGWSDLGIGAFGDDWKNGIAKYAGGTPGLDFVDFGRESIVALHNEEAVVPKAKLGQFIEKHGGSRSNVHDDEVHQEIRRLGDKLERWLALQPTLTAAAVRDNLQIGSRRG